MRPLFISYRRQPWLAEVSRLSEACRRRGLATILDVSDPGSIAGRSQLDALRHKIREESDGLILYLTRNVTESPTVWNVEVPAAFDAMDRREYLLLPVFRDIGPSDAAALPLHGARVSAMAGVVAQPPGTLLGEELVTFLRHIHAEVARQALGALLERYKGTFPHRTMEIAVHTRETGIGEERGDLILDWAHDYRCLSEGKSENQIILAEASRDVSSAVSKCGVDTIRLHGPAHLSAALALGYTFRRASGFRLEAVQRDSVWSSEGPLGDHRLRASVQQLSPSQADVLLILAISRPEVVADAALAASELGIPVGGRIVLQPEDGANQSAVADEEQARAIVKMTIDTLMRARADWRTRGPIHVFMAAPFALAALVGHALNAFAPLYLYDRETDGTRYTRAQVLG